ncbi:MAG: hypothetical protein HUU50_04165 [Candidatus Brocadiae bacterium]|nr:hypothetical protein [Candidatus Brocadiia bacterium]
MSKKSSEEQKEKKKRGFLGYLWLLFLVLLLLLAMSTGFFYWKKDLVTSYALELYAKRLSYVMTSPEYYHPGTEGQATAEEVFTSFKVLVDAYREAPTKEWQGAFVKLQEQIHKIFEDNKVLPKELDDFRKEVKTTAESIK